ncbi:restriction endonuclease subunit S [Treponema succinifaciens]|uniref:restriction endonuclease subunit S n=1 Tax=Treponema succinifaciens TaxID=167 RepID=UPI0025874C03|nr:restriction endonuclease subunit S [uncultured Treponema sp.]
MEEWKECKLGDIVEIHRGASPRPIQKFIATSGMPWVKISDATASNSRFINSTKEFIIEDGISKSVIVNPEDLIVSNSATPGLPKIMKIKACIHDGWLYFSNYKNLSRDFLYYKFFDIQRHLTNLANGSVFQNLKTDIVKDFSIKLPPLPTQQKIAAILSSLDDKIELNNKINTNLEQQAGALFKNWFVDFEPFGGKMPEGWKVGKLSEIADYLNGLAMQKFRPLEDEEGLPVLKIKELRQGCYDESSELCSPSKVKPEYIIHDGDVIFSWSGSLLVDIWCGGTCGLNQHLFKVTSQTYEKWFYYLWTKHHLDRFIFLAADKATTMGHIKREELDKAEVIIPDDTTYQNLTSVIKPFIDEIINNRIENRKLSQIRDGLLPKLMNGEIEV